LLFCIFMHKTGNHQLVLPGEHHTTPGQRPDAGDRRNTGNQAALSGSLI
jgi:hypothetical protein